MIDYMGAFLTIQKVKKDIKSMTFDEAADFCAGFNCDGTLFDFDCGNITGTICNDNGKAVLEDSCCFDVYDADYPETQVAFHGTESEIFQKSREVLISKLREYILKNLNPTNAKEYEILGRAIKGCACIALNDDGSIINGYGYCRRHNNADWRASELINDAIREVCNG